ncbi:MAG: DUF1801 domain-containing protein [Patescibacteria group bacterium]
MKQYTSVDEYLADLDQLRLEQVNLIRTIIKNTLQVTEHVKWNALSYVYEGVDRITFNTHGKDIKVLIHMGATKKEDKTAQPVMSDPAGLIKWNSNIRGTIVFESLKDIAAKRSMFEDILSRWSRLS